MNLQKVENLFKKFHRNWMENTPIGIPITSYNILSTGQSNLEWYQGHKISELLTQNRLNLIKKELGILSPKIIFLQEVDKIAFWKICPIFSELNLKTFLKLNYFKDWNFGNLIGYDKNHFEFVDKFFLNFFLKNEKNLKNSKNENFLQKEMKHGSNAIFLILKEKK